MINFIKKMLGLGPKQPTPVFVPQMTTAAPNSAKTLEAQYIPPAKVVPTAAKKVRAITDTNPGAVAAAVAQKPANKKRRPYRGNKVKAGGTVAKINQPKPAITEGKTKGGNGAVKPAQVAKAKPHTPPSKKK